MAAMKGITIKLPDATMRRLKQQARESRRSIAAIVRDRIESAPDRDNPTFYTLTSDLAGCLIGGGEPATNTRRKFRRS